MRLSTFVLFIVGVGSLAGLGWLLWRVTAERREWNELLSYSGRDLRAAGSERVQSLCAKLLKEDVSALPVGWVARLQDPGSRERALFCQPVPVGARLSLVDEQRRTIFTVHVRTRRWSESMTSLRGNTAPDLAAWTFAIALDGIGAEGIALAHYAILEDRPVVLRLERPSGESVHNVYRDGEPVGPAPPIRSPEEWERTLSSESLGEILATLHWLGGIHAEPVMGRAGFTTESPEEVRTFLETAARPGVLRRLRELSRHAHPWIAHAAEQARLRLEK